MKRLLILIGVCSTFYSCNLLKQGTKNVESFDKFYHRFHTDSLFQLSRIDFPLRGLPSFADESQFTETYRWQQEDWDIHKLIDTEEFPDLSKELTKEKTEIKEHVNMGNGFGLERHFGLREDKWFLVYYVGINKLK